MTEKFQAAFYPYENVSIDEMVIGWKGKWKYKQYNPAKPKKYHIKTFGLCDSITGYVYNLLIYFGKETSYDQNFPASTGQAQKVFEYLLRPLGQGHRVFADRYYTTFELIKYLTDHKTYYTGTLMPNRRNFPSELKTLKLNHRDSRWYRSANEEILCVAWRDKKARKPCILVSSKATAKLVKVTKKRSGEVEIPEVVNNYNYSMNGCDRLDQCVSYYGQFLRKTVKWWKRVFLWLLEVSHYNAFVLYSMTRDGTKRISIDQFKRELISELLDQAIDARGLQLGSASSPGRPRLHCALERFRDAKHLVKYVPQDRNCVVCSTPASRRRTNFVCGGCVSSPHLHPKDCFMKYHTK